MNALQTHKRALAKADLREEFLSGAGCASLLLIEDSDVDDMLSSISNKRYCPSATPAPATSPATASSSTIAAASSSHIQSSSTNYDDIHLDRRRVGKRTTQPLVGDQGGNGCGKMRCIDDLQIDRQRIADKKQPSDDLQLAIHDDILLDRRRGCKRARQSGLHDDMQRNRLQQHARGVKVIDFIAVHCVDVDDAELDKQRIAKRRRFLQPDSRQELCGNEALTNGDDAHVRDCVNFVANADGLTYLVRPELSARLSGATVGATDAPT